MRAINLQHMIHPPIHLDGSRKYLKIAPRVFEVLLVGLIVWLMAQFIFQPEQSGHAIKISASTPGDHLVDIKSLTATALFGRAEIVQKQPVVKQPAKPVVVSPLQVKLKGTVLAEGKSAAIIEPKPGAEQGLFFVGNQILPGVSLAAIEAEYVLIDNHGKREKIMLEDSNKTSAQTGNPVLSRFSRHRASRPGSPTVFAGTGLTGAGTSGSNNQASGAHANFLNMVSLAGLTAQSENGKFQGMSVNQVIPGGLFANAGLQKGDVIQSINGKSIMNTQDARQAYDGAKETGTINMVIIRDGQPQTIYQPVQ